MKIGRSTLWMLALLVAVLLVPAVLRGSPCLDALRMSAFLLAFVAIPGALLHRHLRADDEDALMSAGMAWTIGYCAEALGYLAAKVLGLDAYFAFYPVLVVVGVVLVRLVRGSGGITASSPTLRARDLWPLGVLLILVVCRTPFYSGADWWKVLDEDLLFHAGNAAELRNNWPMQDPRCAGQPLVYHFFSYALPASASAVTGLSVSDVLYGVGAFVSPIVLALQIYNAGRIFGRTHIAGAIASALVMLHVDYGRAIGFALEELGVAGARGMRLSFSSYLNVGVYASTSTASGLMLFATLAILVDRWYAGPVSTSKVVSMALLGAVASGIKGSIMPVLLAGLGATFVWRLVRARSVDKKTLGAFAVLLAASLPMTIHLSSGAQSFASSMFRVEPGAAIRDSEAFATAFAALGDAHRVPTIGWLVLALPLWLIGYLDLIGIGAFVQWVRERERMDSATSVLWASALAGGVAALLYAASNLSQLFFLYSAQIALAILAGRGLAPCFSPRSRRGWLVTACLALCALPMLAGAGYDAWNELSRRRASAPPSVVAYRQGLEWMRTQLPKDAVVVAAHRGILVSAFAERRAFYETDRFTPQGHALGWSLENGSWKHTTVADRAFPERLAIRKRCYSPRPATAVEEARSLVAPGSPVYVLFDDVSYAWEATASEASAPAEPETTERAGPHRNKARPKAGPDRTKPRSAASGSRGDQFAIAPCGVPASATEAAGFSDVFSNDVMHLYRVDAR